MNLNKLKSFLSRFHIRPDKKLGQNFLLSEEVLDQIVEAAELTEQDRVLEIGPGLGFLTKRLAERAGQVLAIEKDQKLVRALHKILKKFKNVNIVAGDALFFNNSVILNLPARQSLGTGGIQDPDWIPDQVRNDKEAPPSTNYQLSTAFKLVANIPYYLTGKILQNFLSPPSFSSSPPVGEERWGGKPSLMVLLLQKEVAERIVAKPGTMSILSIAVQFYADPEIIDYVPRENFYPMPEVDSAIVRLRVLSAPRLKVDENKFFQLVKIGFANKRKQLQNNLSNLPVIQSPSEADEESLELKEITRFTRNDKIIDYKAILQDLGINPLARAQDLSLEDWGRLYLGLFQS